MPNAMARRASPCRCGPCRGWRASCCKARRPATSSDPICRATIASACGILRAAETMSENACSAVEMVFPPGVFMTMMPRRVAASTSTLSTPTPARPMTRSLTRRRSRRRHLRLAAHDEAPNSGIAAISSTGGDSNAHDDFEPVVRSELIDPALRNRVGNQDLRRAHVARDRNSDQPRCQAEKYAQAGDIRDRGQDDARRGRRVGAEFPQRRAARSRRRCR